MGPVFERWAHRRGKLVDGSFGSDPEVFRDLRNTLRLGRGPAVDLAESESFREPHVEPEPACEPRVQGENRLSSNEFLAGRGDEDAPMPPREVQQDSALRKLKEPFIDPRDEPQIHDRVPGEAIAENRAAQQPFRERDLPEIPEKIIERDRPRIEMQEQRVTTQIRDDVVMIAHPHGAAEVGESSDAKDSYRDDSRRAHPCDPRPDPAPSEPIHDGSGDRRLPRAVRAHDRVHVGGPRVAPPRGIRAIVRPVPLAPSAGRLHGRLPSGFGSSFKTMPEIDSTIGETSTTRGNLWRDVSGPPVIGSAAPRNVKVIRLRPLFLLPTGRGEDFPVELQTSRRMRSLERHPDRHTRPHDAVTGGTN